MYNFLSYKERRPYESAEVPVGEIYSIPLKVKKRRFIYCLIMKYISKALSCCCYLKLFLTIHFILEPTQQHQHLHLHSACNKTCPLTRDSSQFLFNWKTFHSITNHAESFKDIPVINENLWDYHFLSMVIKSYMFTTIVT